jgi:hypothetical protein
VSNQQTPSNQQPPFDYQKWLHEIRRQDAQRAHDKIDDFHRYVNEATIKSGDSALRAALLINGGAAVSVLAFIGGLVAQGKIKVEQLNDVAGSLTWFAIGTACAVLAMAASYFTNYFMAGMASSKARKWEHPYLEDTPKTKWMQSLNRVFHVLAVIAGIGSLVIFVVGMLDVREAITHLRHAS